MFSNRTTNILQKILQVLLIAVMATPLIFYKYFYYPFVTGKVLAFRWLVFAALIVFVVYVWRTRRIKYYASPIWWMFLGLVGISFLAAIFGLNFSKSFWSNIERADGVLFLIHLFVYFALLVFVLRSAKDFRWLFRVSLAASLAVIGYGALQYFGLIVAISTTGDRISSTLGNPAYLGSYALMHVFLALYLLSRDKDWAWRIFYALGLFLNFWVIFMTQTRGAVVGLAVGLIVLAVLSLFRTGNKNIKLASLIVLATIVILGSAVFIFKDTHLIQKNTTLRRMASISLQSYTVQTRLSAWNSSFKAFKERPVLGWGPENYSYAFSKYFPPEIYVESGSRIWFDKAHSVFFEYLVATGIFGVLAYFGLLFLVIYYLFKSRRLSVLTSNIFISLLVGYSLANMFVFDTLSTYILFAAVLAFVNNIALTGEKRARKIEFNSWKLGILGALVLCFIYWGYVANIKAIQDNKKMLAAGAYARENYIKESYDFYSQALEKNNRFTRYEIAREMAIFTRNQAKSLPDYEASVMFDMAIKEMLKSIERDLNEIRHYYNLSQLYLNSYKYDITRLDKLIEFAPKMIELAPDRAHTYYQIGEAYVLKKDYDKALENFQQAVELNPKIIDAYVNVYAAAILKGDKELEEETESKMEELEPGYFGKEEVLLRYVPLYKRTGREDKLVESLEKLISLQPAEIKYVSTLAIYWAEQGDNKKAEEVISRLLGLDAELDKALKEFIRKIYTGEFLKH